LNDLMLTYSRINPWSPVCFFWVWGSHQNGQGRE
jgi:hypothetical protein